MIEFRRVPNKLERRLMVELDAVSFSARRLHGWELRILPL
jgi:hypothetical protein